MPTIATWVCSPDSVITIQTDCQVTSYGNATTSLATTTPLLVQDAGDVQFLLAWLIFFSAIMFVALVWNTFGSGKLI